MPAVDLAAIRARHAELLRLKQEVAALLCDHDVHAAEDRQCAADRVAECLAGEDVPALLAYIAELHAAAKKRCDENLATFHRQRALIERLGAEVEEIRATREDVSGRLIAALAELDRLRVRLDEANARTAAKGDRLAAMTRDRDQWRDVAEARDAALKAAASGDCPVGGCGGSTVELHAYGRAEPVAVVLDCGHDTAGGEKATESPAAASDPGSGIGALGP